MPNFQDHVFISYSDADKEDIDVLISILKDNFDLNVWRDVDDSIIETLKSCPKASKGVIGAKLFLCCLSKSYFKSDFCVSQLKVAHGFQKEIIFIMLEDIQLQNYLDESIYKGRVICKIYKNRFNKASLWMGYHYEKLLEYINYVLELKSIKDDKSDSVIKNNHNNLIINTINDIRDSIRNERNVSNR